MPALPRGISRRTENLLSNTSSPIDLVNLSRPALLPIRSCSQSTHTAYSSSAHLKSWTSIRQRKHTHTRRKRRSRRNHARCRQRCQQKAYERRHGQCHARDGQDIFNLVLVVAVDSRSLVDELNVAEWAAAAPGREAVTEGAWSLVSGLLCVGGSGIVNGGEKFYPRCLRRLGLGMVGRTQ